MFPGNLSCGFTPDDSFQIFRGVDSEYPWPGLVFGLTLLATYFFCTNQVDSTSDRFYFKQIFLLVNFTSSLSYFSCTKLQLHMTIIIVFQLYIVFLSRKLGRVYFLCTDQAYLVSLHKPNTRLWDRFSNDSNYALGWLNLKFHPTTSHFFLQSSIAFSSLFLFNHNDLVIYCHC